MSAVSFLEAIAAKRQEHLVSLSKVEDGDVHKHTRIKGVMQGLDEAAALYRHHLRTDSENEG